MLHFHAKMRLPHSTVPKILGLDEFRLMAGNIREEVKEMLSEIDGDVEVPGHRAFFDAEPAEQSAHLARLAKEFADVVCVINGFCLACGIDLDEAFRRVHESNMQKQPGLTNQIGKIMKPPGWKKPDLSDLCAVPEEVSR